MNWKNLIQSLTTQGLTQKQIADACGCSQASISDLSTGKTKAPSFPLGVALMKLAESTPQEAKP